MLSNLLSKRTTRALGFSVPRAVVLDADTLEHVTDLDAGGARGDLAAGPDGVWISTHDKRTITHVDRDGAELLHVELPDRPEQITVDGERPVVLCRRGRVLRVEPIEGRIVDDVRVHEEISSIVAGAGQVWAMASVEWTTAGARVVLMQLDPVTLAVVREIDLGRSRYFGGLRIEDGTVDVLVEESPGSMGYATFDAVSAARVPTPPQLERPRGLGEIDGVRWLCTDETVKKVDASGREIASQHLDVPRTGRSILAHGRVFTIAFSRPGNADNQDTD